MCLSTIFNKKYGQRQRTPFLNYPKMIREKYSQKKGTCRVSRKRQSVIRVNTNIILILFASDRHFYRYQFEWHFFIPHGIFLG